MTLNNLWINPGQTVHSSASFYVIHKIRYLSPRLSMFIHHVIFSIFYGKKSDIHISTNTTTTTIFLMILFSN